MKGIIVTLDEVTVLRASGLLSNEAALTLLGWWRNNMHLIGAPGTEVELYNPPDVQAAFREILKLYDNGWRSCLCDENWSLR
jgi:hypothetical protein